MITIHQTDAPKGRYEGEAKALREKLKAEAVILIVIDGEHGNGADVIGKPDSVNEAAAALMALGAQVMHDAEDAKKQQGNPNN